MLDKKQISFLFGICVGTLDLRVRLGQFPEHDAVDRSKGGSPRYLWKPETVKNNIKMSRNYKQVSYRFERLAKIEAFRE